MWDFSAKSKAVFEIIRYSLWIYDDSTYTDVMAWMNVSIIFKRTSKYCISWFLFRSNILERTFPGKNVRHLVLIRFVKNDNIDAWRTGFWLATFNNVFITNCMIIWSNSLSLRNDEQPNFPYKITTTTIRIPNYP